MEKGALDRILKEFIDSELNVIGYNDIPANSPDMASNVGTKTTDYNTRVSQQQWDDRALSRLGYQFPIAIYEDETGEALKRSVAEEIHKFENSGQTFDSLSEEEKTEYLQIAERTIDMCRKQPVDETLSEADLLKMMEDKFASKKDTSLSNKKADTLLKSKGISDIIDSLSKEDKELLLKKLEQ